MGRDARASDAGSGFSKGERECVYWTLLILVLLSYLAVIDKSLFFPALEDSGIYFARVMGSPHGAMFFGILGIALCRCSPDPRKAVCYGFSLFLFVAVIMILSVFVFPNRMVPVPISDTDVAFQTPKPTELPKGMTTPPPSDYTKEVRAIDQKVSLGMDDLQSILGFSFVPIILIGLLGSCMWVFRIDSGKAMVATGFVILLGCFVAFKVMVLDPHNEKASPVNTIAEMLPLPQTWVAEGIVTPSSRGALARLRGVNARLDDLLSRT